MCIRPCHRILRARSKVRKLSFSACNRKAVQAIQLAVAPVFLLALRAADVTSGRLVRIVENARRAEALDAGDGG